MERVRLGRIADDDFQLYHDRALPLVLQDLPILPELHPHFESAQAGLRADETLVNRHAVGLLAIDLGVVHDESVDLFELENVLLPDESAVDQQDQLKGYEGDQKCHNQVIGGAILRNE